MILSDYDTVLIFISIIASWKPVFELVINREPTVDTTLIMRWWWNIIKYYKSDTQILDQIVIINAFPNLFNSVTVH